TWQFVFECVRGHEPNVAARVARPRVCQKLRPNINGENRVATLSQQQRQGALRAADVEDTQWSVTGQAQVEVQLIVVLSPDLRWYARIPYFLHVMPVERLDVFRPVEIVSGCLHQPITHWNSAF